MRVYDQSLKKWMSERKPAFVRACQRIETIAEFLWAFGEAEKVYIGDDSEGGSSADSMADMSGFGGNGTTTRPGTRQLASRGAADPPKGTGAGGRSSIASVPSKMLRFLHRPLRWQDIEALGVRVRPPTGGDGDSGSSPKLGSAASTKAVIELQMAPPLPAAS